MASATDSSPTSLKLLLLGEESQNALSGEGVNSLVGERRFFDQSYVSRGGVHFCGGCYTMDCVFGLNGLALCSWLCCDGILLLPVQCAMGTMLKPCSELLWDAWKGRSFSGD